MRGIKETLDVLMRERATLDAAIAVLKRFDVAESPESAAPKAPRRKRRKPMSAEQRKQIGERMRAAHARRRAENNGDISSTPHSESIA